MAAAIDLLLLQRELLDRGLVFAPPLSDAELLAFEQAHQVMLPSEYRRFLQQVGNGGSGPPEYGLRPLGATESWWGNEQRAAWQHFESIRRPFPFTQPWYWEDETSPDPAQLAAVYDGTLYLGTDGCGMDWALVVTGQQRGYVWQISEAGITPCQPALTFLEWVNQWLHYDPADPVLFWWRPVEGN
jgi:hypothetical protein